MAFAWPAMEAFYEKDERILGHAADSYHRIDIRQSSSLWRHAGRCFDTPMTKVRPQLITIPVSCRAKQRVYHWPSACAEKPT